MSQQWELWIWAFALILGRAPWGSSVNKSSGLLMGVP